MQLSIALAALLCAAAPAVAQPGAAPSSATVAASRPTPSPLAAEIDRRAAAIEQELIVWRRHLHEHPELSNREVETAKYIATTLRSFGLEPKTGVAAITAVGARLTLPTYVRRRTSPPERYVV